MALDREIIRKKFLKNLFLLKNINLYFQKDSNDCSKEGQKVMWHFGDPLPYWMSYLFKWPLLQFKLPTYLEPLSVSHVKSPNK